MAHLNSPRRIAIAIDLSWPFKRHLEIFDGINRYAVKVGWETIVVPLPEEAISRLTKWPYDGVIGRLDDVIAKRLRRAGVPAVNVWLNSPAKSIPSVFPDWEAVGQLAADHLLSRGFRRFAFLGFRRDRGVELQYKGFQSTIQDTGCDCKCYLFDQKYSSTQAQWHKFSRRLTQLSDSLTAPVGVCATDDLLGRFMLDACLEAGYEVPHDMAVLSADNESLLCENSSPSLSSIDLGYQQIGWKAGELLDQLIQGTKVLEPSKLHQPETLILRQSTDVFSVEDPEVAMALRFIAANSHHAITVSDVASHVMTSRRTLERRFQDVIERTIAGEITRMRLERTKRQLLELDEPIKTVARFNGFRDASHLCTVFRRELGITPGEFRAENLRR